MNRLYLAALLFNFIFCAHHVPDDDQDYASPNEDFDDDDLEAELPDFGLVHEPRSDMNTADLTSLDWLNFKNPDLIDYEMHLEETILQPVIESGNPDLVSQWVQAFKESNSIDDLKKSAEDLLTAYNAWNTQLELAFKLVTEDPNLGPLLSAYIEPTDISSVSRTSKHLHLSMKKKLAARYLVGGQVDWTTLFIDLKACKPAERGSLTQFIFEHWPKTEDEFVKILLIQAQCYLREFIQNEDYQRKGLQYIPGHLDLYNSLADAGVIESFQFPLEAFYHEEIDVIKRLMNKIPQDFLSFEIQSLLSNGDENAIGKFTSCYPATSTVNGETIPMMEWEGLRAISCTVLAIFHHKDTIYHRELLDHLEKFEKDSYFSIILLNSNLSTKDVFMLTNGWLNDEILLKNPERLLDLVKLQHGDAISLERIIDEDEGFEYALQLINTHGPLMAAMAVLAGTPDEILMKMLQEPNAQLPDYMLYPAMFADRNVELVDAILNSTKSPIMRIIPYNYQIPRKYLDCLFKYDEYAIDYVRSLGDLETPIREGLQCLNLSQLEELLTRSPCDCYGLKGNLIFFEILFNKWHSVAKEKIEAFCVQVVEYDDFKMFLLSQSLDKLEGYYHDTEDEILKLAIDGASHIKKSYRE